MNDNSPTPVLDRVSKRREDATKRALDAAMELFTARGYFETSMAEIARRADVAVGTLYNLFENKDQLYRTLIHTRVLLFHTRLSQAIARGHTPLDCIRLYVNEMAVMFHEQAAQLRLYLSVLADARFSFSASLPPETRKLFDDGNKVLADCIDDGIKQGVFHNVHPYRAAAALQAVTLEFFFLNLENPSKHPTEDLLGDLWTLISCGLAIRSDGGNEPANWNGENEP